MDTIGDFQRVRIINNKQVLFLNHLLIQVFKKLNLYISIIMQPMELIFPYKEIMNLIIMEYKKMILKIPEKMT
jgi:hypothetical protein